MDRVPCLQPALERLQHVRRERGRRRRAAADGPSGSSRSFFDEGYVERYFLRRRRLPVDGSFQRRPWFLRRRGLEDQDVNNGRSLARAVSSTLAPATITVVEEP